MGLNYKGPLDPDRITLTRHCLRTLMHLKDGAELVTLLVTLQSVAKNISAAVRR